MALDSEQLVIIRSLLRTIWKDIIPDASALSAWESSFKPYAFADVEAAVRLYIASKPFKPSPADIISMIPAPMAKAEKPKPTFPAYQTMPDGQKVRVIRCKRCNDLGLIMWRDDQDRPYGRPCSCETGLARYGAARQ